MASSRSKYENSSGTYEFCVNSCCARVHTGMSVRIELGGGHGPTGKDPFFSCNMYGRVVTVRLPIRLVHVHRKGYENVNSVSLVFSRSKGEPILPFEDQIREECERIKPFILSPVPESRIQEMTQEVIALAEPFWPKVVEGIRKRDTKAFASWNKQVDFRDQELEKLLSNMSWIDPEELFKIFQTMRDSKDGVETVIGQSKGNKSIAVMFNTSLTEFLEEVGLSKSNFFDIIMEFSKHDCFEMLKHMGVHRNVWTSMSYEHFLKIFNRVDVARLLKA